jgi:hypothetical protein
MANKLVVFTCEWREVPTSCEPCAVCKDAIYGKQFQMYLEPGGATGTILCESCRLEIDNLPDSSFDINWG